MKQQSKSKKLAWTLVGAAFALTVAAIVAGMDTAAMTIWPATMPFATGLYANKQYQDRKYAELKQQNNGDTN